MQIEAQSAPETVHQAVSKKSEPLKSKRGGKRPGAVYPVAESDIVVDDFAIPDY